MDQQDQEIDKWKAVYKEVRAAWDFRVANINAQQQRIANVLFANGLIFGFLGASAGIFFDPKVPKWPTSILYVASMCALALGLVAAVAALWPLIDPPGASPEEQETQQSSEESGKNLSRPNSVSENKFVPLNSGDTSKAGYFLDPGEILKDSYLSEVQLLKGLCNSIVANAKYSKHMEVVQFRRYWIRAQLICIVTGILLLISALITRLFTG